MSNTTVATSVNEVLAVAEHLIALYDTREMCETQEELDQIDTDIAQYARRFPDGFANFIKSCAAEREKLKQLRSAVERKGGLWAAREASARLIALEVIQELGPLEGSVFKLSEQQGREHAVIDDPLLIPPEYYDVIPEQRTVNLARVEAALKAKRKVPGARLERHDSFVVIR